MVDTKLFYSERFGKTALNPSIFAKIRKIQKLLVRDSKLMVLDVGGDGTMMELFQSMGHDVYGIEISNPALTIGKKIWFCL